MTDPVVFKRVNDGEGHPYNYIRTPLVCVLEATKVEVSGFIYLNNNTDGVEVVSSGDYRDVDPDPYHSWKSEQLKDQLSLKKVAYVI